MHWTVIATALTLALISAYLVFVQSWAAPMAFAVVGGSAFLLIAGVLTVVLVITEPRNRPQLMREVLETMRRDLDDLLRWIHLKH